MNGIIKKYKLKIKPLYMGHTKKLDIKIAEYDYSDDVVVLSGA